MPLTRWRWRLRGAWQWPAFALATAIDGVMLNELPVWGRGPGGLVAGWLLAAALNLVLMAAVAPLLGRLARRRRPDLPRAVATDYAATVLVAALFAGLLAGGLAHRGEVQQDEEGRSATAAAVANFVHRQERGYLDGLERMDIARLDSGMYRSCVPGAGERRPLCLIVRTDQRPPGITRDPDRTPNLGDLD